LGSHLGISKTSFFLVSLEFSRLFLPLNSSIVSRMDRWGAEEWSNNRIILQNDVLNYLGE